MVCTVSFGRTDLSVAMASSAAGRSWSVEATSQIRGQFFAEESNATPAACKRARIRYPRSERAGSGRHRQADTSRCGRMRRDHLRFQRQLSRVVEMCVPHHRTDGRRRRAPIGMRLQNRNGFAVRHLAGHACQPDPHTFAGDGAADQHDLTFMACQHPPARDWLLRGDDDLRAGCQHWIRDWNSRASAVTRAPASADAHAL